MIYEKIKQFIKNNYKIILVYIFIICIFTINLPYYISAPGGLLDTKDKVKTEEEFRLSGSLNMAYVTEIHATIPTFLWSFANRDWDLKKQEDVTAGNESIKDMEIRNKLLLAESNDFAELVAYKYSNIDYDIENDKVYVCFIDSASKTDLKIGDQILEVDGVKIVDKSHLLSYIASKNVGDQVIFKVLSNGKEKKRVASLIDVKGSPKVGAMIAENFDITSDKNIKFTFSDSESGSSGGLMLTLTIYGNLNRIDLTSGKKIVGTGTIDINGNVGEISGVKYKLIGAVKNKADVFLVPEGDNYKEAKRVKKEKGYDIDIVPVETFEEALRYLTK